MMLAGDIKKNIKKTKNNLTKFGGWCNTIIDREDRPNASVLDFVFGFLICPK